MKDGVDFPTTAILSHKNLFHNIWRLSTFFVILACHKLAYLKISLELNFHLIFADLLYINSLEWYFYTHQEHAFGGFLFP